MSYRTQHEQSLDYFVETLLFVADEMKTDQLRLLGKIFATAVIGGGIMMSRIDGNIGAAAIAAMWVVTIPSLVEAWIIAKGRQKDRRQSSTDD